MTSNDLNRSLPSLFSELVFGAPESGAFTLNRGDPGLLASLDRLSAIDASASRDGGATIAAHVDHLCYGFSLLIRWAGGESPFDGANWSASWERTTVTEADWAALRTQLRREVNRWHTVLQSPREIAGPELDGVIASVVHLAYHFGAIRQIAAAARGPKADD